MSAPERERMLLREATRQAQAAECAARAAAKAAAELCNLTHAREGEGVDRIAAARASDHAQAARVKAARTAAFLENLAKTYDLLTAEQCSALDDLGDPGETGSHG